MGEWRSSDWIEDKIRGEMRAALDALGMPACAVSIKVRKGAKFMTLKADARRWLQESW